MSVERRYVRSRSLSRVRRSCSFDPYLLRRSESFGQAYDQHVRRSFTPVRDSAAWSAIRSYYTPPGDYAHALQYTRGSSTDLLQGYFGSLRRPKTYESYQVNTYVPDDRPYYKTRYDVYVPSGWSTPLYKYMHPEVRSSLSRPEFRSYLSTSYPSGEIQYYQAEPKYYSKPYKWKHWLERASVAQPWYRMYLGECGLRHFGGYTPRYAQHYSRAIWL